MFGNKKKQNEQELLYNKVYADLMRSTIDTASLANDLELLASDAQTVMEDCQDLLPTGARISFCVMKAAQSLGALVEASAITKDVADIDLESITAHVAASAAIYSQLVHTIDTTGNSKEVMNYDRIDAEIKKISNKGG